MSTKIRPVASLYLLLIFGGAFVTALMVELVWHFYAFGQAL
jgi:hypothetical protein